MRVPLTRGNGHFLIISESGGYKSSGIVTPAINSHIEAIFLLDPKCVAYQQFAPIRRAMGRNPIRVCATDGIDPLRMLKPLMEEHPSVYFNIFPHLKEGDFPGAHFAPFELTLHRRANALPPCP